MPAKTKIKKIADDAFKQDAKEAPRILRRKSKNMVPSWRWDEINSEQHVRAFTVAKVMEADVLQALFDISEEHSRTGEPIEKLTEKIKPRLQEMGWWGKDYVTNPETGKKELVQLGSEHRLRLIIETNANIARARGAYKQMMTNSHRRPYVLYTQLNRETKNHDHTHLDGKIFRIDDPYIIRRWPPSAFGCDCSVSPMSEKQALRHSGKKNIDDAITKGGDMKSEGNDEDNFPLSPIMDMQMPVKEYKNNELSYHVKQELRDKKLNEIIRNWQENNLKSAPDCISIDKDLGVIRQKVNHAMKVIDKIHKLPSNIDNVAVGKLPSDYPQDIRGQYIRTNEKIKGKISLKKDDTTSETTMVHEFGHFFDTYINNFRQYESTSNYILADFKKIVKTTSTYKNLTMLRYNLLVDLGKAKKKGEYKKIKAIEEKRSYLAYLLKDVEVFARAYQTYISVKSNDKILMKQLKKRKRDQMFLSGLWDGKDEKRIVEALDEIFNKLKLKRV
jgi:hypothetical protein